VWVARVPRIQRDIAIQELAVPSPHPPQQQNAYGRTSQAAINGDTSYDATNIPSRHAHHAEYRQPDQEISRGEQGIALAPGTNGAVPVPSASLTRLAYGMLTFGIGSSVSAPHVEMSKIGTASREYATRQHHA
jgi:hypothetical protein